MKGGRRERGEGNAVKDVACFAIEDFSLDWKSNLLPKRLQITVDRRTAHAEAFGKALRGETGLVLTELEDETKLPSDDDLIAQRFPLCAATVP